MKKIYFLLLALGLFTGVNAQVITIPDESFKGNLLSASPDNTIAKDINDNNIKIDTNSDGQIQVEEALNVYKLDLIDYWNVQSLIGIQSFTNLRSLDCSHNIINGLFITQLTNLTYLNCEENPGLAYISFGQFADNIETIICNYTNISFLNLNRATNLNYFSCNNCMSLTNFKIKNGNNEAFLSFSNCPLLTNICADDNEIETVLNLINTYNLINCQVNTYCTFAPGGTSYTIKGNSKFDNNNNGCDGLDSNYPDLKFSLSSNSSQTGGFIPDSSGSYLLPVQSGTHTITPILENPSYFNVSPSSVDVTFPAQSSPFTQNFCITPNGSHADLEITLFPLVPSRPGFDAKFKIVYRNKGTTVQSGSVVVDYFNNLVDFVSSNPAVTIQSANLLTWNYTNLQPFEVREITFTVNVNSPSETPAVNMGDILSFESYIYPIIGDLTTNDNHSGFRQVVVGSFDPNDKTCLEGTTISPDRVGEYVHYMIRFENTGTFAAENIVVKDMIDLDKFDISSLVPIKGSHSFVTNITAGNKVEFIFENINLPFDNANNDGYVAFKIKTKPTLVLGNTFSNTASIYFDYNFPIVTNTATTTIAALSRQDFEFSNYFNLYPNPVHDILNIAVKETIEITSINIYNTLGQLVLVIPNAQNSKTVDVSNLTSGNYFIKINSDKGISNTKFIKN